MVVAEVAYNLHTTTASKVVAASDPRSFAREAPASATVTLAASRKTLLFVVPFPQKWHFFIMTHSMMSQQHSQRCAIYAVRVWESHQTRRLPARQHPRDVDTCTFDSGSGTLAFLSPFEPRRIHSHPVEFCPINFLSS